MLHHVERLVDLDALEVQVSDEFWLRVQHVLCCHLECPAEELQSERVVTLDVVELAEEASELRAVRVQLDCLRVGLDRIGDLLLLALAMSHLLVCEPGELVRVFKLAIASTVGDNTFLVHLNDGVELSEQGGLGVHSDRLLEHLFACK